MSVRVIGNGADHSWGAGGGGAATHVERLFLSGEEFDPFVCVCVCVCVRSRACVRGRWTVLNHVPRAPSLLLNCRRAQQLLLGRGHKRAACKHTHARTRVWFKTWSAHPAAKQQAPPSTPLRAALFAAAFDKITLGTRSFESETLGGFGPLFKPLLEV